METLCKLKEEARSRKGGGPFLLNYCAGWGRSLHAELRFQNEKAGTRTDRYSP